MNYYTTIILIDVLKGFPDALPAHVSHAIGESTRWTGVVRCSSCSYALASLCCTRNRNLMFHLLYDDFWCILWVLRKRNVLCPCKEMEVILLMILQAYTEASSMGFMFCWQLESLCFSFSWPWNPTEKKKGVNWVNSRTLWFEEIEAMKIMESKWNATAKTAIEQDQRCWEAASRSLDIRRHVCSPTKRWAHGPVALPVLQRMVDQFEFVKMKTNDGTICSKQWRLGLIFKTVDGIPARPCMVCFKNMKEQHALKFGLGDLAIINLNSWCHTWLPMFQSFKRFDMVPLAFI